MYDDDNVDQFLNLLDPAERKGRGAPTADAAGDDQDGSDGGPPPPDAPDQPGPAVAVPGERMGTE